jgi:hypothetical protein
MDNDAVMEVSRRIGAQGGGAGTLFGMTAWGMMASLLFSGIGYYYFKRGRYQNDTVKTGCGVALMVYPYFVSNAFYIALIGAALMAVPYIVERF